MSIQPRAGSARALSTLVAALLALTVVGLAPPRPSGAAAAGTGDDYLPSMRAAAYNQLVDPWMFYNRQCTSFAAWRLNQQLGRSGAPWSFSNNMRGPNGTSVHFGNATQWRSAAVAGGWRVDSVPQVGSVAYFAAYQGGSGRYGHVAIVSEVAPDGTVTIEEYNMGAVRGMYGTRTGLRATAYLHVADTPPALASPRAAVTATPLVAGWDATPTAGRPLAATVTLRNPTRSTVSTRAVRVRVTGAGTSTTPTCWTGGSLLPGQSRACRLTLTPATAGALALAPDWQDTAGTWGSSGLTTTSVAVAPAPFADVAATSSLTVHAAWATTRRVLAPTGQPRTFAPTTTLQGGDVARALHRLTGSPRVASSPRTTRTSARTVADPALTWATTTGVLPAGTATTTPVTRQQLADALHVVAGRPAWTPPTVSPYADLPVTAPGYRTLAWALATGRLAPVSGAARPTGLVDRATTATAGYVHAGGR